MLFVRTEKRPGHETPEHFFVESHDRVVWNRWLATEGAMPDGYELVSDPDATARAARLERGLTALRHEYEGEIGKLTAALKRAVATVSPAAAAEIRRVYREAQGTPLPPRIRDDRLTA